MPSSDYTKRRERIAMRLLSAWVCESKILLSSDHLQYNTINYVLSLTDKLIEKLDEDESLDK